MSKIPSTKGPEQSSPFEMVRAGDHCSRKISKQILPLASKDRNWLKVRGGLRLY